jgi:hypothetical protein
MPRFATALRRFLVSAAAAHGIGACVPEFDDDSSLLDRPRVLAVRAEPAEAKPGESVTLSALLAAPDADDADPAELEWELCVARKPLTELGPVTPACVTEFRTKSDALDPLGTGGEVALTLAADVCRQFGPLQPPPEPGSDVSGRAVDPDSTGGFYQPVMLGLSEVDEEPALAAVRIQCGAANLPQEELIELNQGYRPNENPEFAALELRVDDEVVEVTDAPVTVPVGETVEWNVRWAECPAENECGDGLCTAGENATECREDCQTDARGCTGAERYLNSDLETRTVIESTEELRVGWYATTGGFALAQTGAEGGPEAVNEWIAPEEPGPVQVWVVLRDDRGGVAYRSVRVEVVE